MGNKKPKFNLQDLKKAADVGREVLPLVQPAVEKYGPAAAEQVKRKAKQVGAVAVGARDAMAGRIQEHKDAKELKKAREEARKRAITGSLAPVDAEEFFKSFEANVTDPADLKSGYMAISGCYAIVTLKSPKEKDLSAYKDVYVGRSEAIGFDVYTQLCGLGNVDVYADFKYKQPMKILTYPCDVDQLEQRFASLVEDLRAAGSYNKWDAVSSRNSND